MTKKPTLEKLSTTIKSYQLCDLPSSFLLAMMRLTGAIGKDPLSVKDQLSMIDSRLSGNDQSAMIGYWLAGNDDQ
jgi:hypothetical protein